MLNKFKYLLLTVTVLTLVTHMTLPLRALAQSATGEIRGTVTDERGGVIQNAAVTLTSKGTGEVRKADTGHDGIYAFSSLLPGEYEVRVEATGFATHLIKVTVQVGNTSSGDAALRVGGKDEIVDVVSEAVQIDKQNYKIDGVITRQKIDALPLNGRNFLSLALLEPGVGVSTSNPGNANNLFNVSIGGAPSALTRITVDGGSIVDFVTGSTAQQFSTETIQEFQISTFNFDLSTGVTSVGHVNIVSRTGSNTYHGSALGFWRDDQFAAVPTLEQGTPTFSRWQYGGSFGGPIKKDRALFFGNAEWLNQDAVFSTVIRGFAPLSQFNTNFGSPYDNKVANIRVDFPSANQKLSNIFVRYSFDDNKAFGPVDSNTLPSNWRVNTNRDHNVQTGWTSILTQNLVNDFRFNYHRIKNDSLIPTESDCPTTNPACTGLGGVQIRVNKNDGLILGNSTEAPQNRVLDRYQFNDNVNWNKGSHRVRFGGEWEHNYGKGGWSFLEPALIVMHDPRDVLLVNTISSNLPAVFRPGYTIPVPASFITPGAKITVQDLLQLPIAVAFVGIGNPEQPPPFNQSIARQSNRYRFYGQDTWQIRQGFNLSFGASYLYETNLFNHDLSKPALLRPLIGDLSASGKDKNNIAPSLGFAWDVGNKGKTVVRGGAGIYYDTALFVTRLEERALLGPLGNGRVRVTGDFFQNPLLFPAIPLPPPPALGPLEQFRGLLNVINPPLGARINFQVGPTKFTGQNFMNLLAAQAPLIQAQLQQFGAQGFSGIEFFKTGTGLLDPGNVTPYSEQFSLGLQHELRNNLTLSADFVLRHRLHTQFQNDYNLTNRVASRGGPVIPACTALQSFNPTANCSNGNISVVQHGNRETYKALLVKVDKRFANKYQFTASYALSSLRGFFTGADLTNWFGNPGYLGNDARHRFTFSGVIDLPLGFQASMISVLSSRGPFNATIDSRIDLDGDGTRGDVLPGLEINSLNRGVSESELRELVGAFNSNFAGRPDAAGTVIPPLVLPSDFRFGDNFQSHDVRLAKTFTVKENYRIQALVEVFNLFNTANLGGFGSRLDSGALVGGQIVAPATFAYGQPTSRAGQAFGTGGPRAIQFGAKLNF